MRAAGAKIRVHSRSFTVSFSPFLFFPMRNLLIDPIWRAEDMGQPIPPSTHAVSVALPTWDDVVGYEEKRPETVARMRCGYPRFVVHPLVEAVAKGIAKDGNCLPFPSMRAAAAGAAYVTRRSGASAQIVRDGDVFAVVTTAEGMAALRAYWQHVGLIVSSRQAEAHLAGTWIDGVVADAARASLRGQLAGYYGLAAEDVFLHPTGMASIFAVLRAVNACRPARATAQLGFPYVDSLKVQQEFGMGTLFLTCQNGEKLATLQAQLEQQPLAACFTELPGNPLLGCIDLTKLGPWLRERDIPLVVDDVVATPYNVDLRSCADVIVTSLTKYFAGSGDVMGGAVLLNPRSPFYAMFLKALRADHEELLWGGDAIMLDEQARNFPERMRVHNANGLLIAERLRAHPSVAAVYYPKWESCAAYEAVRRPEGGWGNLLSFLVRNPARNAPRVYDALEICKGPTLGTTFTLACPFTLLAHYGELDWAESCGVSRYLIRVSVGMEEPEALWGRFAKALALAE